MRAKDEFGGRVALGSRLGFDLSEHLGSQRWRFGVDPEFLVIGCADQKPCELVIDS